MGAALKVAAASIRMVAAEVLDRRVVAESQRFSVILHIETYERETAG